MRMRQWLGRLMLAAATILPASCSWVAKAPMDVLYYPADEGQTQKNLFVFMRGMGGSHRSFAEEGLVADVRTTGLPFDMAAPNAHLGYYARRTLIERLKTDVIDPARRQGKDNIWLVGFSMGGLGSLLYLKDHPEDVDGVCVIAPFLGDNDIIEEIRSAGGVRAWQPGEYDPEDDYQRMLWHWIKDNVSGNSPVPIFLGYGTDDRLAPGGALLAEVLPKDHVVTMPGGHDYPTFKALWKRFLESRIYLP